MSAKGVPLPSEDVKKPSLGWDPAEMMAFSKLPDEIIEQILRLTNPNGFASLIVLNRKWRAASQQAHLYAHQLSRCPSYSAAHHSVPLPEDEESLPRLRRLFAREIKRNLFEAYLRPSETIISLVSTSISSSSAPGGEAFHFSLSPRGHYVLAYSSSRIHVIDVTGPEVVVKRELKILRRPASTTITDDGSLLAVLSTDMQVDLYDLTSEHPKHTRAVALDHTPRTIALSPTGAVLAAAYDSGVEVSSLDPGPTSTERRAVKCYAVDSLSFSKDGTQLLGTTVQSRNPSTVVLTAPYYDPGGNLPEESISALWTTSILFPNGSRDCSHAVLLPSPSEGEASWTFTYDRVFETFRAVRIDDLRNGTTYFTGPTSDSASLSKLLPSTLPSASETGDLVASGFQGVIWIYGVPEDLEAVPTIRDGTSSTGESEVSSPSTSIVRRNSAPSLRSVHRTRESTSRIPQWQLLCDKNRNTFIEGRKITSLDRVSSMAWVQDYSPSSHRERLVAVAPGVGGQSLMNEDDGMTPVDGGRISILDFDYSPDDGRKSIITIEVGNAEPEVLEEEHRDLDTEVAIVRRRTVAQRRGNRNHVSRAATTISRPPPPPMPALPSLNDLVGTFPRALPTRRPSQQTTLSDHSEGVSVDEDQEVFEAPYSQTSPRSGTTLRRAATAAAVNRRLHPRAVAQDHIQYRRADGREEHPHESDADNWVPPPPPYTKDPVPPLPEHIQRSLLAEAAAATLQRANTHRTPAAFDFPGLDQATSTLSRSRTVATIASSRSGESRREHYPFHRTFSDSTAMNSDRVSLEEVSRPMTSPSSPDFDDLYDVSPPGTPQLGPRSVTPRAVPVNHIPRKPVGAPSQPNHTRNSQATPTPDMGPSLQQPISPVPQPTQPPDETMESRLEEWESVASSQQVSPEEEVVPTLVRQSTPRSQNSMVHRPVSSTSSLLKEVPPRPDENHHLTELPPTTPVMPNQREMIETQIPRQPRRSETTPVARSPDNQEEEPLPIWHSGTAPTAAQTTPITANNIPPLVMPNPDQIARLNSRRGRPSGLADPRRISQISNHQPQPPNGSQRRHISSGSIHNMPPQNMSPQAGPDFPLRNTPPRAAIGAYSPSPQQYNNALYPSMNNSLQPTHRLNGHSQHRPALSPGLRPPIQRLETIHSQTSAAPEPSPYFAQKQIMVSRQPSRAERSAAKNIKDAKKRGWRASMKEKSKKKEEAKRAQSSAGWTDVTRDSAMTTRYMEAEREHKSGKCAIM